MKGRFLVLLSAFLIFILDRLTKEIAIQTLEAGRSIKILPVFYLTLVRNRGTAFGLLKGMTPVFIFVAIVAILFIIVYIYRSSAINNVTSFALSLLLGGSAGNLVDRIRFGYVIDFLDFRIWPVFNIADSAITIGTVILGLGFLTQHIRTTNN